MSLNNIVHVAVAVVKNQREEFLIAKRAKESHQGNLWEFPGGKVEQGETVLKALKRELFEETGITLNEATPLIRVHHNYGDKSVLLDVWSVNDFKGKAYGKEEQKICWVNKEKFSSYDFPAANYSIIKALQLPDKYMITGEFDDENELLARIQSGLNKGIKLIQFRAHHLLAEKYFEYAKKIFLLCIKVNAKLLLNTSIVNYKKYYAVNFSHGLHLSSIELKNLTEESDLSGILISASVHNEDELRQAKINNIDFVVLSPVKKTRSHPDVSPLGWNNFCELVDKINIPVYALGGMSEDDIPTIKKHGGQGMSAISEFWCD